LKKKNQKFKSAKSFSGADHRLRYSNSNSVRQSPDFKHELLFDAAALPANSGKDFKDAMKAGS